MVQAKLEQAYTRIIAELAAGDDPAASRGDAEQRQHPRLKVRTEYFTINAAPEMVVLDLSRTGVAFHSQHPLAPGEAVQISLDSGLAVPAQVLSCDLEEGALDQLQAPFRVVCVFDGERDGLRLVVDAKSAERAPEA